MSFPPDCGDELEDDGRVLHWCGEDPGHDGGHHCAYCEVVW